MNKKILFALILSTSIMFCGCSSSSPAAAGSEPSSAEIVSEIGTSSSVVEESIENEDIVSESESIVETAEKSEEQQYLIDSAFDKNSPAYNENLKSIIQSQIKEHNNPYVFIEQNWVYGINWKSNGNPIFVKERSEGGDYTILDKNGAPENAFIKDAYIYYALSDGIYKIRTSGHDRECIIETKDASIQVVDDYIYYSPDTYASEEEIDKTVAHLYRCKLDGSENTEIIDRPTFCWYVFENAILYQDDRDNESIHILNLVTNEDIKLNDETSYNPTFDGEYIYYVRNKNDKNTIWKMRLDGTENQEVAEYHCTDEVTIYNNKLYFSYEDDDYRLYCIDKNGSNLTQISQDPYVTNTTIQGDTLLYIISTKGFEYIDHIAFCDPDGSNVVTLKFNN